LAWFAGIVALLIGVFWRDEPARASALQEEVER